MNKTRYITKAVFNGTHLELAISGRNVDTILNKARRDRIARNAVCFLFISRKTGKLVDTRMN